MERIHPVLMSLAWPCELLHGLRGSGVHLQSLLVQGHFMDFASKMSLLPVHYERYTGIQLAKVGCSDKAAGWSCMHIQDMFLDAPNYRRLEG